MRQFRIIGFDKIFRLTKSWTKFEAVKSGWFWQNFQIYKKVRSFGQNLRQIKVVGFGLMSDLQKCTQSRTKFEADQSSRIWFNFRFTTCGVVDLRSSDVVPPLLLNFT